MMLSRRFIPLLALLAIGSASPSQAVEITRLAQGTLLRIDGLISAATVAEIDQRRAEIRAPVVVHLTSRGGNLEAGVALGKRFQAMRAMVATEHCSSACVPAFLAARERWLLPGARLGFHRPKWPGGDENAAVDIYLDTFRNLAPRLASWVAANNALGSYKMTFVDADEIERIEPGLVRRAWPTDKGKIVQ